MAAGVFQAPPISGSLKRNALAGTDNATLAVVTWVEFEFRDNARRKPLQHRKP
jgi:hypothetical protein